MNTGIQDAISLASALHSTLQNGNDDALKDWHEKRLEIARSVASLADRITKMATISCPALKALRNAASASSGMFRLRNMLWQKSLPSWTTGDRHAFVFDVE